MTTIVRTLGMMLLGALLTGCGLVPSKQERALERVAKDWSQVVRASQIVPIYPLSEDLLPGDVFLVQTSLDEQVALYRKRGFLPIDAPFARLPVTGYGAHYRDFRRSRECPETRRSGIGDLMYNPPCLENLPIAAFPSYSFEVGGSQGFGIGIPLQAVNVGLNLTRSSTAIGSVSIQDAYTYGVDVTSLLDDLDLWVQRNPERLKPYRAVRDDDGRRYRPRAYLRVVSRVYVARALDVYLQSTSKMGGGADAQLAGLGAGLGQLVGNTVDRTLDRVQGLDALNCGLAGGSPVQRVRDLAGGVLGRAGAPVERVTDVACRLPPATVDKLLKDTELQKRVKGLTQMLGNAVDRGVPMNLLSALPSVRLKVTSHTDSSVGMTERFERPLAVGYVGFDVPIDPEGRLGPPMPSFAVLERSAARAQLPLAERAQRMASWNEVSDGLIDHSQAYAAATETMRCVARELGDATIAEAWRAQKLTPASAPVKIYNAIRNQIGTLAQQNRIQLQLAAELLALALRGQPACAP